MIFQPRFYRRTILEDTLSYTTGFPDVLFYKHN